MSYETKTVSGRDGLFQVEMRRGGKGDPLVYLHGAGGQDAWDPFFDLLAERYTVYQPFSPGWRGSTGLDHLDDVHDMAVFYLDLLHALGPASLPPGRPLARMGAGAALQRAAPGRVRGGSFLRPAGDPAAGPGQSHA